MFIVPVQKRSKTKTAESAPKTQYQARPLNGGDIQRMSSDELRWHVINNRQALDAALQTESKPQNEGPELSYDDIERMDSKTAEWHIRHNEKHWQEAFEREENRRNRKTHIRQGDAQRQWAGCATTEEIKKAYEAGGVFSAKFPQFLESPANIQAMLNWMKDNGLPATELSSYISAYRALSQDGRLEERKVESATEFLASHLELQPTQVPPLIAARIAKKEATETFFKETAKAAAASGSTKVVEYEPEQRGPLYANTNKASFRNMPKNLSADEYLEKMQDPQFRAAVDQLGEK